MPIDLQTLAQVRVKFLEAREHLSRVIPSPNQLEVMRGLSSATYEFNRVLKLSAARQFDGSVSGYYADALLNISVITGSDFRQDIDIDDARDQMLEAAIELHAIIMKLPLPSN